MISLHCFAITLIYMNISAAYVYSAYGHIDLHDFSALYVYLAYLVHCFHIICLHLV
ncbi:hypothetical protein Hanom_Chr11g01017191 [Helianthus anomalus]